MTIYMKQKEKKRIKQCKILALIMAIIVLAMSFGCQRPMTDRDREERLKELLKDKYGEEFEVKKLYTSGAVHAICYPTKDFTMIFEVRTPLEMERIEEDDYLQNIVGRQIDEEFQTAAEAAFGNCFVFTNIPLGSTDGIKSPCPDTVTLETILEYEKENGFSNSILIDIYAEGDSINGVTEHLEYDFIKTIGAFMDKNGVDRSVLTLYFGSHQFVEDAKVSLEKWGWTSTFGEDNINEVLDDKKFIYITFSEGTMVHRINDDSEDYEMVDYSKYVELKKEILK